jgi:hypothetical protein
MLHADRSYRMTFGEADPVNVSGAWLIAHGLTAPPMKAEQVVMVRVRSI